MAEVDRRSRMALGPAGDPGVTVADLDRRAWRRAKRLGFSDRQLDLFGGRRPAADVRAARLAAGVGVTFKTVDTCGAEFEAPRRTTTRPTRTRRRSGHPRDRVVILGSGPNRIGQGIEFDYCCVHARRPAGAGYETVMVNCNPETVSTDYDISDRLYFEPLTAEDVANVLDAERAARPGPARRGHRLARRPDAAQAGRSARPPSWCSGPARPRSTWPRTASSGRAVRAARHRPAAGRRRRTSTRRWRSPPRSATRCSSARATCSAVGRWRSSTTTSGWSSAVDGRPGRGGGCSAREGGVTAERPVLVDRFLEDAVEVDVDAVRDPPARCIGGVMEHVEEAGVHSGDSACALPPQTLSATCVASSSAHARASPTPRGRGPHQRAVRGQGRRRPSCSRPTRGRAARSVRGQGHRRPVAMVAARVMVGAHAGRAARRGACFRSRRSPGQSA